MLKGYIIITVLLAIDFCLYVFIGVSLSGQLSDKILFWIWLIMTIIVVIKFFTYKKWLKWYLGIVGAFIILSVIPMGMPFFALIEFATNTSFERRIEDYRLRDGEAGLIDQTSIIKVVRNMGIIEIEFDEIEFDNDTKNYSLFDVGGIRLLKEKDDMFFEFEISNETVTKKIGNNRSNYML
ncbi:hypothetical protein [uncultured Aquimarina sp.]|uniref:hypothetical protein n=1 Tax=uncultured Aquimarina sp. TaxID=575652 RepID=UPI0026157B72|nr:hypothetical protein [uncultured Aquimarina sp.]